MDTIKEVTQTTIISDIYLSWHLMKLVSEQNYFTMKKLDQIEGYQDHGCQKRINEIASKVLTFMAIRLRKNGNSQ